jgi:hypothetical protein
VKGRPRYIVTESIDRRNEVVSRAKPAELGE